MSRSTLRKLGILVLLGAAIAAVMLSPLRDHMTVQNMRAAVAAMQGIWYGPILFLLAFILGSILLLPASVFILPAGLVWGWKLGFIYSMIGGTLGAVGSFAIAKYLGGGFLSRFGVRGQQIARKLDHAGFKTLLILRLIPLWPFPVYNYGAGLAGVRSRDFVASTIVGLCPSLFVMSYSADALFRGTLSGAEAFKRLLIAGLLVAALILIPSLFRRKATRALHLEEDV